MNFSHLKKAVNTLYTRRSLRRTVLVSATAFLFIWISFFDSHSLAKRFAWSQEADKLAQQNEELRLEIERLERQLDTDLSDEVIEQMAREQYGMRKEGETVYKIEELE